MSHNAFFSFLSRGARGIVFKRRFATHRRRTARRLCMIDNAVAVGGFVIEVCGSSVAKLRRRRCSHRQSSLGFGSFSLLNPFRCAFKTSRGALLIKRSDSSDRGFSTAGAPRGACLWPRGPKRARHWAERVWTRAVRPEVCDASDLRSAAHVALPPLPILQAGRTRWVRFSFVVRCQSRSTPLLARS